MWGGPLRSSVQCHARITSFCLMDGVGYYAGVCVCGGGGGDFD